jgi:hypothetical protein
VLRPNLQEPRASIEIGARQIGRRPPGALRLVDIDDGVKRGERGQAVSARLLFFFCGMNRSMKEVLSRPA